MTALGSSKAPPDASRQASPLALLLACCNETRQLFVSHIVDCAALRLACKDGRELVDGAISAPCHLTINGGWLHRVPALLHTLAARWPLRSDLLLTAKGELLLVYFMLPLMLLRGVLNTTTAIALQSFIYCFALSACFHRLHLEKLRA